MIIPVSLKTKYEDALPLWKRLKDEIDSVLAGIAEHNGGKYFSRIKQLESAVLKLEKERQVRLFEEMEDMLAGSIVLPTISEILPTKEHIERHFEICEIRPSESPDPRKFDGSYDLHLILKQKDNPYRQDKSLLNFRFEVQVKTLLQQAWGSASHDIIYKPKRLSYSLTRIASQVRALLELADLVIANIEAASKLQTEPDYPSYAKRQRIIEVLENNWDRDRLPTDRRRAALIVEEYMELAGVKTAEELTGMLSKSQYAGFLVLRSVTPTQIIFMILFIERNGNLPALQKKGRRVLITEEMLEFCPMLRSIPEANRVIP